MHPECSAVNTERLKNMAGVECFNFIHWYVFIKTPYLFIKEYDWILYFYLSTITPSDLSNNLWSMNLCLLLLKIDGKDPTFNCQEPPVLLHYFLAYAIFYYVKMQFKNTVSKRLVTFTIFIHDFLFKCSCFH